MLVEGLSHCKVFNCNIGANLRIHFFFIEYDNRATYLILLYLIYIDNKLNLCLLFTFDYCTQLLKYTLIVTCKWRVYTKLARLHVICVIAKHIAKLVKSTSITTDITRVYYLVRLKSENRHQLDNDIHRLSRIKYEYL